MFFFTNLIFQSNNIKADFLKVSFKIQFHSQNKFGANTILLIGYIRVYLTRNLVPRFLIYPNMQS